MDKTYFAKQDFREWCEKNWMNVNKLTAMREGCHRFGITLKHAMQIWETVMEEKA